MMRLLHGPAEKTLDRSLGFGGIWVKTADLGPAEEVWDLSPWWLSWLRRIPVPFDP